MNRGGQGGRRRRTAGGTAVFLVLLAALWTGGCSDGPPEHGLEFILAPTSGTAPAADLSNAVQVLRRRIQLDSVRAPHLELSPTGTILLRFPSMAQEKLAETRRSLTNAGWMQFRRVRSVSGGSGPDGETAGVSDAEHDLLQMPVRRRIDGREVRQMESFAVKRAPERGLTGRFLKRAYVTRNPQTNEPEIAIEFDPEGAERLFRVTSELTAGENAFPELGIVIDGRLHATPVIREPVADGRAVIQGEFDTREALSLAGYLNFPLPVLLRIVDEREF